MTLFLTIGARGALGRALYAAAKKIEFNAVVHGTGRTRDAVGCDTAHVVDALDPGTVLDLISRLKPDGVFLTAWETRHGYYWTAPENAAWAEATLKVLEFCADCEIAAVFAGTCAEYAWGTPVLVETDTDAPATEYGLQKRRVSDWIAGSGAPGLASARLFFPFSADENPNRITTLVAKAALHGEDFHLRAGDLWRDVYPTSVAAEAMVNLLLGRGSGVFNLSGGQPEHLGRFLDRLAQMAGTGSSVTWAPYQPDHGPRRLVGDPTDIKPFWPTDWDMTVALEAFLSRVGQG